LADSDVKGNAQNAESVKTKSCLPVLRLHFAFYILHFAFPTPSPATRTVMIRVTCPACRSKLHAKDELAGQTRKCPKCGAAVRIASTGAASDATPPQPASLVRVEKAAELPRYRPPERLSRLNHYFICDRARVLATWQNNGEGWLVRGDFGFASAHRNPEKLPSQGDFRLVELRMEPGEGKLRLQGLRVYQLAKRWALVGLARGDDTILKAVTGAGSLLREQKNAVRQQIKEQFMQHVWEDSPTVLEYLANNDYHSPGTPEGKDEG
jgi:hypothetical protein